MTTMPVSVKPQDVLKFTEPTKNFLCAISANTFGIEFLQFKIRDTDSGKIIFQVNAGTDVKLPENLDDLPDETRFIKYDFGASFLRYKSIGTSLKFRVGPKEIPNFRMIERHYFKNKLIKSFDFKFGFCIPNSTNTWEVIYEVPPLTPQQEKEMVACPYETKSDSFYFVNDAIIMHNKAEYAFSPNQ